GSRSGPRPRRRLTVRLFPPRPPRVKEPAPMIRPHTEGTPTLQRVTAIFREKMHLGDVLPDTNLFESGALDSLGFVNLLVHLEEAFGFQVSLAELELDDFRSAARIAGLVDAYLAGGRRDATEANGTAAGARAPPPLGCEAAR